MMRGDAQKEGKCAMNLYVNEMAGKYLLTAYNLQIIKASGNYNEVFQQGK
jgi:hypothetical protein